MDEKTTDEATDLRVNGIIEAMDSLTDLLSGDDPQPAWKQVEWIAEAANRIQRASRTWQLNWLTAHRGKPFTKWDLLPEQSRIALEDQPYVSYGNGGCSQCGTQFQTEADFAKHFIVPDPALSNLGYCPNKERRNA